eukprot:scaffold2413_cov52-Phaeocystis_antarctica.AAC.2
MVGDLVQVGTGLDTVLGNEALLAGSRCRATEPGGGSEYALAPALQWLPTSASQCHRSQSTPCRFRRRRSSQSNVSRRPIYPRSIRSSRPRSCTRSPWWAGTDPLRPPAPRHAQRRASASARYFSASSAPSTWKAAQVTLAEQTGISGPESDRRTVVTPFHTRICSPPSAWNTTAVELILSTREMRNEVTTPGTTSLMVSPLPTLGRARGAPGKRDAERLHAEELVVGEHGGHDKRQVVRRHAGAHDLALGIGHGGVALDDVGVLVDRRHERKKATDAEEQDEGEQEEDEQHVARLLEVQARLQVQESEQGRGGGCQSSELGLGLGLGAPSRRERTFSASRMAIISRSSMTVPAAAISRSNLWMLIWFCSRRGTVSSVPTASATTSLSTGVPSSLFMVEDIGDLPADDDHGAAVWALRWVRQNVVSRGGAKEVLAVALACERTSASGNSASRWGRSLGQVVRGDAAWRGSVACLGEHVRGGARAWRSAGKRGLVCVSVRASAEDTDRGRAESWSATMRSATTRGVERLANAEAKGWGKGLTERQRAAPPTTCAHENAG